MKRILLLIVMATVTIAMPVVAQKNRITHNAINRASELIKDARYEESNKIIDSLLTVDSNNSDALYLRCNTLLKDEKYAEALDYCNLAIDNYTRKSYYDDSYLYHCRGDIKVWMLDIDNAIIDLTKALELTEKRDSQHKARTLYSRAGCHLYNKDYEKAEEDLFAAYMYDEGYLQGNIIAMLGDLYIDMEQYDNAIIASDGLLEIGAYPAYAYYIRAYAHIGMGDYEDAIDNIIAMVECDINSIDKLGCKWMLWSDVENARNILRQRVAEDTENESLFPHIAVAEALHDYETMLALFELCEEYYDCTTLKYWHASYSAKAGNYQDAIRHITELIDAQDTNDIAAISYLIAERCGYYRLAGDYDNAIADANRFIELCPDMAYGYYIRGWNYELLGDDKNAMANYNKGIELDDSYAYIYLMRGEQYLKYGDSERAKADFERVLELDNRIEGNSARQYALHFLGRDKEAVDWMERTIANAPYDCGNRYDEACLYARMGNVERALDALRMALYLGYKSKAHIEHDDDMDPIRHSEAYQRLMEEYFNK